MDSRLARLDYRVERSILPEAQRAIFALFRNTVKIWILVKDGEARTTLRELVSACSITPDIFTIAEVAAEVR